MEIRLLEIGEPQIKMNQLPYINTKAKISSTVAMLTRRGTA